MDYPSNLPAFSREGLLGLLQGLDRFQILPTDELRGVRQGLLSNDPRGTATNLGLLGLGMTPVGKAAKVGKKVIGKFTTSRGSTYEHFEDATTQRFRSGRGHTDTSTGLQPPSNKTVFVSKSSADKVGGLFQNPDMSTKLVPVLENGKVVRMKLVLNSDFGKKKAGEVLADVNVSTRPSVGK